MKKRHLFFYFYFLTALQACNMVNPKEDIPTYIQIDSVKLSPTLPNVHGSVAHKITDVWVYLNRELLGAYQIPAKVPILTNQTGQLQFVAGVYENGLSGTRAKYPFYTVDTFTIQPNPTNTIHYQPTFYYQTADNAVVYYLEDFEQGNSFTKFTGDTSFVKTNSSTEVFEGNWSAKLELIDTITNGESISVNSFTLPSERISYMELNYKTSIPFIIKLQITRFGAITTIDLTGVKPTTGWSKIYFNLGAYGAGFQNASFKMIFSATLPSGITSGNVFIDNYKLIYFKQ